MCSEARRKRRKRKRKRTVDRRCRLFIVMGVCNRKYGGGLWLLIVTSSCLCVLLSFLTISFTYDIDIKLRHMTLISVLTAQENIFFENLHGSMFNFIKVIYLNKNSTDRSHLIKLQTKQKEKYIVF